MIRLQSRVELLAPRTEWTISKWSKPSDALKSLTLGKLRTAVKAKFQGLRVYESATDEGWCRCVTCGKAKRCNDRAIQGGHWLSGTKANVAFLDCNVHSQCFVCNIRKQGNLESYERFMVARYGETFCTALREVAERPNPAYWSDRDWLYEFYAKCNAERTWHLKNRICLG